MRGAPHKLIRDFRRGEAPINYRQSLFRQKRQLPDEEHRDQLRAQVHRGRTVSIQSEMLSKQMRLHVVRRLQRCQHRQRRRIQGLKQYVLTIYPVFTLKSTLYAPASS